MKQASKPLSIFHRRRGLTLLMTLLVLVLAVTVVGRQAGRTTQIRMSSAATAFVPHAQWIAEGAARQWLERSDAAPEELERLFEHITWRVDLPDSAAPILIEITPSCVQHKLLASVLPGSDVLAFWARQPSLIKLAEDLEARLTSSGNTALEVILAPEFVSGQAAYEVPSDRQGIDIAPADVLTVWGDGRIDLNHCSIEMMRVRLKFLTDAQISGIMRLRGQEAVPTLAPLAEELSLSEHQARLLGQAVTFGPREAELLIRVKHGGLEALFHAVVSIGKGGRLLELRPIY